MPFHWGMYTFNSKDGSVELLCVTDLRSQYRMNKKGNPFTIAFCVIADQK